MVRYLRDNFWPPGPQLPRPQDPPPPWWVPRSAPLRPIPPPWDPPPRPEGDPVSPFSPVSPPREVDPPTEGPFFYQDKEYVITTIAPGGQGGSLTRVVCSICSCAP